MQKQSWYILAVNEHWGLKVSKVTDIRPAIASVKEKGAVALSVKWVRLFACKLHFCDFHCHRKHREDEKWVMFFGCLLWLLLSNKSKKCPNMIFNYRLWNKSYSWVIKNMPQFQDYELNYISIRPDHYKKCANEEKITSLNHIGTTYLL